MYRLLLEHSPQTEWDDIKFFSEMACGAVGGGLFLAGAAVGNAWACAVGFLLASAGKGLLLLMDLGRPERFWRVMMRPFSSWLSFGGWCLGLFGLFGFIHTCLLIFASGPETPLMWLIKILAMLAAVIIITYDGMLMASSRAIAAWGSGILAPMFGLSALAAGCAIIAPGSSARTLVTVGLLLGELLVIICYLGALKGGSTGARASLAILLTGEQNRRFLGGVLGVGLVGPLLILATQAGRSEPSIFLGVFSAVLIVAGVYWLRIAILKSGVTTPVA